MSNNLNFGSNFEFEKIMRTKYFIVAGVAAVSGAVVTNSCMAVATSSIGLTIIKNVLLGGISKGMATLKDKEAFMNSTLIDQAIPSQLKSINNTLQSLGMSSIVQKEKQYIADAAYFTANISEPILNNAVNSLTADDVTRIAQGGSGMATQILKEKTQSQLIAAITPKVDAKLNEFGLVNTLNNALKGSSILGSLFGNQSQNLASNGISQLASEQIVNGLFNIIRNYEEQNANKINQAFGTQIIK